MSKANPTRPAAPEDEKSLGDQENLPDTDGPALRDPRAQSAMDNIGLDDQGDLLDLELDDQPGDRGASGDSFADDVRSDTGVENGEPK